MGKGGSLDISGLVRAVEAREGEERFPVRLSAADWQRLGALLERRPLQPGELLMRRGDSGQAAYLVESGQLQVFMTGGQPSTHRIATLRGGDMVGEPGLFATLPRMAHVEATQTSVVWRLCARRLHGLAAEAPPLVLEVLRAAGALMARRMQANLERGIPLS